MKISQFGKDRFKYYIAHVNILNLKVTDWAKSTIAKRLDLKTNLSIVLEIIKDNIHSAIH